VLLNLIINARDALPSGGRIAVSSRKARRSELPDRELRAQEYVALAVSDNGGGMSDDVLARAKDPYFTTKADGQGSGLGLALAQEFAVRCGGTLQIDSRAGEGTVVEIFLPCAGAL
jgi:signal transduction histidine kinase